MSNISLFEICLQVIQQAGFFGQIGWLSLLFLAFYAIITIVKYRSRKNSFIPFYGISCAQFLFFVLSNGIWGIALTLWCVCSPTLRLLALSLSQILMSLFFEMLVVGFLVAFVALFTRTKPQLSSGITISLWLAMTDILVLTPILYIVITFVPSRL